MNLDLHTATNLRIAFTIYGQGKDGSFWLDKAQRDWETRNNGQTIPDSTWAEIRQMIAGEFSELLSRNPKLWRWVYETPAS